jgi:HAT1-interacting factor 1
MADQNEKPAQTEQAEQTENTKQVLSANDVAPDFNDDDDIKSKKVTLADLSAKGTALYAHKKYEDAADVFSTASVLQAEINGETAPENAEILFHYGRSLFKVGQSKSDVLGGNAPATEKKKPNGKAKPAKAALAEPAETEAQRVTEEGVAIVAGQSDAAKKDESSADANAKKPLFQFTGDENFVDSDEEEEVRASPLWSWRSGSSGGLLTSVTG